LKELGCEFSPPKKERERLLAIFFHSFLLFFVIFISFHSVVTEMKEGMDLKNMNIDNQKMNKNRTSSTTKTKKKEPRKASKKRETEAGRRQGDVDRKTTVREGKQRHSFTCLHP